ncbi:transient receptor potential cation channel subfamily V member 5-like [Lingula anatina]|uniref:Transient receptor potential cation channel subfamily V member 5-like n=1 Tax=Lingula anatina TaxID=7574 RepID=A0A1S3J737_LINAN|nr:transient receptor potential cation channel subfamily V member 5-like [Lingula anatina]|eukprot:XP_013405654.1 transient receptor potential cation channel subfamily V member 5-like [Lingula anatina]
MRNPEVPTSFKETRNVGEEFYSYAATRDLVDGRCTNTCCLGVVRNIPSVIINTPCCCVDLWQNCSCYCFARIFGIKSAAKHITPKCKFCVSLEGEGEYNTESILIEFTKLWPSADVSLGTDEEMNYRLRIQWEMERFRSKTDPRAVTRLEKEILELCTKNYANRLQIVCDEALNFFLDANRSWYRKGLTPLHIALLHNSTEVAIILIERLGKALLFKEMAGSYTGATALHIATANGNFKAMEAMFYHLAEADILKLLRKCATGEQFKRTLVPAELPLSLAVLSGNAQLVQLLIEKGAPLDGRDSQDNTVLHTIVLMSQHKLQEALEMYEVILNNTTRWWCRSEGVDMTRANSVATEIEAKHYLFRLANREEFTALTLAAKVGVKEMFEKILNTNNIYRFSQWEYGHTTTAFYDVTEIDPVLSTSRMSALELLVYTNNEERIECLSIPVINHLLHIKWHNYRMYYITWGILHLIYMLILSLPAFDPLLFQTPSNGSSIPNASLPYRNNSAQIHEPGYKRKFPSGVYLFLMVGTFLFFIYSLTGALKWSVRHRGNAILNMWKFLSWNKLHVILLLFSVSMLSFLTDAVKSFQPLALLLGWVFLIFFTRGFRQTSFFSAMIQRIMLGDLLRFLIIYLILTAGFSSAIGVAMDNHLPSSTSSAIVSDEIAEFDGFGTTMWTLFRLMVGLSEIQIIPGNIFKDTSASNFPVITLPALLITYVVLVNILLMNMLIATMTDTYTHISKYNDLIYKKLRTTDMIFLERMLPEVMRMLAVEATYKICRVMSPTTHRNLYLLEVEVCKKED